MTIMQRNKRHMRRRTKLMAFKQHITYTDGLDTFDWISRDSVYSFSLVLTLTGVVESSSSADSVSRLSAESDSADSVFDARTTHDTGVSARTTHDTEISSESSPSEQRRQKEQRTVTLGEVYLGCAVPAEDCVSQWQTMLLQPRQTIVRWQDIH